MKSARCVSCLFVAAAFALSCGGGGGTSDTDTTGGKDVKADGPDIVDDLPDVPDPKDINYEVPPVDVLDIKYPDQQELEEVEPPQDILDAGDGEADEGPSNCPGGAYCPCDDNTDCDSEFCIEAMDGWRCMAPCLTDDSCQQGWTCAVVAGTGGDVVYGCVDKNNKLCKPCKTLDDCANPYVAGQNLCIEFGPQGYFCGSTCAIDDDCPAGFACLEAGDGRPPQTQCVPLDGADCPCNQKHIDKGYLTFCYVENEVGKCLGERTCDTECDADVPATETCNDMDEDCDGLTDEEVPSVECDITNPAGTCPGTTTCLNGDEVCEGQTPTAEICNGMDDNCDGETDEFFPDMDLDDIADCVDCDKDGDEWDNENPGCPEPIEPDNCPDDANPGQEDCEEDGIGDICDPDDDDDQVANIWDNCLCLHNPNQENLDGDNWGDACDCDIDADTVMNSNPGCPIPLEQDNCPYVHNLDQKDMDFDQDGDACDDDIDGDGIPNEEDNCPIVFNSDQADLDKDDKGDLCDCDIDGDAVFNEGVDKDGSMCPAPQPLDNCVWVPNPLQEDLDGNLVGDACDCDIENDGIANSNPGCPVPETEDNCPMTDNPGQEDCEEDGIGDACDDDDDNDQVPNVFDNCRCLHNPGQEDLDQDQIGDACDCELDGDGIDNPNPGCPEPVTPDNCPDVYNPLQDNQDGDPLGDQCDCDIDGDEVYNNNPGCPEPNPLDNCPYHHNPDQIDLNNNGVGDVCDNDPDADGVITDDDNCPYVFNPLQEDMDGDGIGDVCDCDADGDGVFNTGVDPFDTPCPPPEPEDNCPWLENPDQANYDGDEHGDLCDPDDDNDLDPDDSDCAPLNENIFHGQTESCNGGLDDNCNGLTDEPNALDCASHFYDFDQDGYGVTENNKCLCNPDGLFSALAAGDCQDYDELVNPGAPEVCNSKDDNCDGQINESGAEGCNNYYQDLDGDGFGDENDAQCLCAPAYPYNTPVGGDCNDLSAQAYPGASETCNGKDDNCDGQTDEENAPGCTDYFLDQDQDGFGVETDSKCLCIGSGEYTTKKTGDCDDANDQVHPDADEACNGVDDNCDGTADEEDSLGCETYFYNFDWDGYGVGENSKCLCGPEELFSVTEAGDCNDYDGNVFPGADEICNGKDDNCDGKADEDGSQGCLVYHKDLDGDNYGAIEDSKCLCAPAYPHVTFIGGDCDDLDPQVHPGATEYCNGKDDNCDSSTDEADATGCATLYRDHDLDGFGTDLDQLCLCAAEGEYTASLGGDCDDDNDQANPNMGEVCNLIDDDCNGQTDEENAQGCSPHFYDFDNDGYGVNANSKCLCGPEAPYNTTQAGDCDDYEALVNPGVPELCNTKDDNCDGQLNEAGAEGCVVYFKDQDSDGFGKDNDSQCLCTPTYPYITPTGGDCNDQDGTAFPGATETCNGKDDDCDGLTDEEGAPGCSTFYRDQDQDGFGLALDTQCLCNAAGEYTATVTGDCDDTNELVNPNATEACNGVDDNCDSSTDEADSVGCSDHFFDFDDDNYGLTGDSLCLCGPSDNYTTTVSGDCDDDDLAVNPGATEACNGKDDNCDDATDEENADGCTTHYLDMDNDAYGIDSDTKCLCDPAGDHSTMTAGDCNDADGLVNPAADEACNGVDDNCNGQTDEGFGDIDQDGIADCVDPDMDEDGILNADDNCPGTYNPGQEDANQNGFGDVCEGDWDGDGVINAEDNCPWVANENQEDMDGDLDGDVCDCDMDDDGVDNTGPDPDGTPCVADPVDNCPDIANPLQEDLDVDAIGDVCDPDIDGDLDPNETDCAPVDGTIFHGQIEACNGIDDNCDGVTDEEDATGCTTHFYDFDADSYGVDDLTRCLCAGDGFYTATVAGDCNNSDAEVNPGATEICNGKDDDCNSQIDEEGTSGCTNFHFDNDSDGFGADGNSKCYCAETGKYSATVDGDCDDSNNQVYPGATESCNAKDDDCDDLTDEEDAAGCTTYFKDEDLDTFGLSDDFKCLCAAEGSYTATQGGDCDDTDPLIFGGGTESCNGLDDDCDGATDEEDATGCTDYYYDFDVDTYGVAGFVQCLCTPEGFYTALVAGDCKNDDAEVNPGATEACNGKDDDCDDLIDEQDATACTTYHYDGDSDGFGLTGDTQCHCQETGNYSTTVGGDCNDTNNQIYPDALEVCNTKDDDCDGGTDEEDASGCSTYFYDGDEDTYGLSDDSKCLCATEGFYTATQGGDCDDTDPAIYGGGTEVCNGLDDDCDGVTDEENTPDCTTFYYDFDSDGFGVGDHSKCLCAAVGFYTATVGGDCDNDDELVNPDATEACNAKDDDCNGATDEEDATGCATFHLDNDSDGFGVDGDTKCLCQGSGKYTSGVGGDCNDSNNLIHPEAFEACNGKDDDCDGTTDEENAQGCTNYFYDGDEDTYGQTGNVQCLCAASGFYTAIQGGDCDDTDPAIYGGGTEVCNGLDDDCDSYTDEEGATDCLTYYYDLDGDGFGVAEHSKCLCGPEGFYSTQVSGDCDNYDGTVNPDAAEACNGKDDDCNGQIDEGSGTGCSTFYYDNDSDGFGVTLDTGCFCTETGKYSATVGEDCNDSNNQIYPDATEVCNDKDDNCDGTTDEEDASGCTSYYYDGDADTYGLTNDSKCLCDADGFYTATEGGDCDDTDPDVYGGVPEVCNGKDDDCNGVTDDENSTNCVAIFYDGDEDGYGLNENAKCLCNPLGLYSAVLGDDCNDNDALIYPGATESCNSKDDDCDALTDEEGTLGCAIFYFDNDADGFGDSAVSKCYCQETGKYSASEGGDCNESDKNVYPGANELCNQKDDDCDSETDEAGAQGCTTYYLDEDQDDYGTGDSQCLCGPTGLYTAIQSGDCLDQDELIHPGATEICNDKDDDCNGQTDESGALNCILYYLDLDLDDYGVADISECSCDPLSEYFATEAGDCNDNDAAINPGAVETCNGKDDNCDSGTDDEDADGCTEYNYDGDADGWGSDQTKCLCVPYGKYTSDTGGDCNDLDLNINPGATESCNGKDDDCDGSTDEDAATGCTEKYLDADDDTYGVTGFVQCLCAGSGDYTANQGGDCDDSSADVNPSAAEACNGVDDNCNGTTDEDAWDECVSWYYDFDQDGWGSAQEQCLCAASGFYSATQTGDCDDGNADKNPGETEICNDVDDNCDGFVDEEDSFGCTAHYFDFDDDAWGTGDSKCLCGESGYYRASQTGDCNDAASAINPDASEVCGNGKDDDCDSSTDEVDCLGCITYYLDSDDDNYGITSDSQCLSDPAGDYTATLDGDCDDTNADVNPGAFESCNSVDDDCDAVTDEEDSTDCGPVFYDADDDDWGTEEYKCLCAEDGLYRGSQPGDCNDSDVAVNPDATEQCNSVDDNCNGATDEGAATGCTTYNKDYDGDGWGTTDTQCTCTPVAPYLVENDSDCDDANANINPSATEVCNGKDDECDGATDEENAQGCGTFFLDADGDTLGVDGDTKCLCAGEGQYTATVGGDCDDSSDQVFPGATESCNGIDDDCNGHTDELGSAGCATYYYDGDTDTWGTSSVQSRCQCAADALYSATQLGDCNDSDENVNPDATEACNWIDDDCDGATDEEDGTGCTTYFQDGDGDGYGVDGQSKCLCAPGGNYTAAVAGDCNDVDPAINPGASESCNGKDDDCDSTTDEEGAIGCQIYYTDVDQDLWGSSDSKCLCNPEDPYLIEVSGDCNDNEPDVNPSASETCNALDDDCDGATDEIGATGCQMFFRDEDEDGWGTSDSSCLCTAAWPYTAASQGDCNDASAPVSPDATETCNSVDDDCDGITDEEDADGCTTFFYDNDGDNYGDSGNSKCLCAESGKFSANVGGDCNDNDNEIRPGATEICNGKDDDCDGDVDEENAVNCLTKYLDVDGDTYGVTGQTKCLCASEGSYSAGQGGDCDDADALVHPTANEICNGKDDDCNGSTDPEDSAGCTDWLLDFDNDDWGILDSRCLCAPEAPYDATGSGDCDDQAAAVNPDATEQCNGIDDDCDSLTDEQDSQDCLDHHFDSDNDGFGVDTNVKCLCAPSGQYVQASGDCHDNDAAINPNADESCNGKDDDCDGSTDEENATGCTTMYFDDDADGYGIAADSKCLCAGEGKYTAGASGDCNDGNDAINPDATEVCSNGIDDNCNGQTDEGGCQGCIDYYLDFDSDTWGVTGDTQCLSAPSGNYSATRGQDCDDLDATVNPGMDESCNGKDDDCDSLTDEENATDCTTYHFDFDEDGFGVVGNSKCLCATSGKYTAPTDGDCNDIDSAINPNAGESCNDKDDDCDGSTDEEDATGCSAHFLDIDADDFGQSGDEKCLCDETGQYTATTGGDCDDSDGSVNPVAPEVCLNLKDDNCDGATDEEGCQGCVTYYLDVDNDTWGVTTDTKCLNAPEGNYRATRGDDCVDSDPSVHPDAVETCNNKDDNCDGNTDEDDADGCTTYYFDFDGDGFGISGDTKCACASSGHYTAVAGGDCNDQDVDINPNGFEECNSKDDDCDGETDEEGAIGCSTYYFDSDSDAFGVTVNTKCLCAALGLYAAGSGGDCDDGDGSVNPDATEACNGKDDNCDGLTDPEGAPGCNLFYFDADQDAWGTAQNKCLCAGSGLFSAQASGDCHDLDNSIYPGATESCNAMDDDCDGTTDEEGATGCVYYYWDGDDDDFGLSGNNKCLCSTTSDYTASVGGDCDDANGSVNPDGTEVCNSTDDDCNGQTDEGNAADLCSTEENSQPVCSGGVCSLLCDGGYYDLNGSYGDGCECGDTSDLGDDCADFVDLGTVSDAQASQKNGNGRLMPDDEDWYRFLATDSTDAGVWDTGAADKFHVTVEVTAGHASIIANVYKGASCSSLSSMACTSGNPNANDFDWDVGNCVGDWGSTSANRWNCCREGECSEGQSSADCCGGANNNNPVQCAAPKNLPHCANEGSLFFVKVFRLSGTPTDCDEVPYTIVVGNGN